MKRYKIEIWRYHRISETYESDNIDELIDWWMLKWYWSYYYIGECAFEVYDRDRAMSFDELYELGFYGDGED